MAPLAEATVERSKTIVIAIFLAVTLGTRTNSQATAVPFLLLPSAVESHALGRVSTLLLNDPLAVRSNPSLAPLQVFDGMLHGSFYSPVTDWLPSFKLGTTFEAQGGVFGLRLTGEGDRGWTAGFGVNRTHFFLGKFTVTGNDPTVISTVEGSETAFSQSVGLAYSGPIIAAVGVSFTQIQSRLPTLNLETATTMTAKANSWSWGATAVIPFMRLFHGRGESTAEIRPFADLIASVAITDVGKGLTYSDQFQEDPLPRAATMGVSISAGMRTSFLGPVVTLLKLELMREATDVLAAWNLTSSTPQYSYQSGLGDLRPFADVIGQKGHRNILHKKGLRAEMGDILAYSQGSFDGSGFGLIGTSGFVVSTRGLFLFIRSKLADGGSLAWLLEHVSLRYARSAYKTPAFHPLEGTKFTSLSFTIH